MRRKGILLVVFTVLIAGAGLAYAHWMGTLTVDGNINTGGVGLEWQDAWTNDDADDHGGEVYDFWGEESGRDPANPDGSERYDKDVGGCWAYAEGDHLGFDVQNAYPSYHCMIGAYLANTASVPVKATALGVEVGMWECHFFLDDIEVTIHGDESGQWIETFANDENGESFSYADGDRRVMETEEGLFADMDGDEEYETALDGGCDFVNPEGLALVPGEYEGNFAIGIPDGEDLIAHITGDIGLGVRCGTQIDPGDQYEASGWIHVEQDAWQNAGYSFMLQQDYVNWNEFSYCDCTDGVPAANADGEIIGTVDHGVDGCLVGMGPTVDPGYSDLTEAAGVRYRGNSSGNEIYLGIPDLGVGGNRVETSYPDVYSDWQDGTYDITFSFDQVANKVITTIDDGAGDAKSLEYDFDDLLAPGCPIGGWNTMDINVVDRLATGELDFNNVMLDGIPLGDFGGEGWLNWTVSDYDFSQSFTVSGDMVVQGWTGSETNKLQITVGCLP